MAEEPRKKKRPADTNQLAKSIVDDATSEEPEAEESPKATAGRKGGQKGGRARADSLTSEERSEIARKAAAARWSHADSSGGSSE